MYAYCGKHRRGDIGECIRKCAEEAQLRVKVDEIDLCRGGVAHDLTDTEIVRSLRKKVCLGDYSAVIATPPCNTHSRAVFANRRGPRPLRSKQHPGGIPGLPKHLKDKVTLADQLIAVALALCSDAATHQVPFLAEHPEDLGRAQLGDPASIWQTQVWRALVEKSSATTAAIFQCQKLLPESDAPAVVITSLVFGVGGGASHRVSGSGAFAPPTPPLFYPLHQGYYTCSYGSGEGP